jgi:hypothetical protein
VSGYACSQDIYFTTNPDISEVPNYMFRAQLGYLEEWQSCTDPICTKVASKKNVRILFDSLTYLGGGGGCQTNGINCLNKIKKLK